MSTISSIIRQMCELMGSCVNATADWMMNWWSKCYKFAKCNSDLYCQAVSTVLEITERYFSLSV